MVAGARAAPFAVGAGCLGEADAVVAQVAGCLGVVPLEPHKLRITRSHVKPVHSLCIGEGRPCGARWRVPPPGRLSGAASSEMRIPARRGGRWGHLSRAALSCPPCATSFASPGRSGHRRWLSVPRSAPPCSGGGDRRKNAGLPATRRSPVELLGRQNLRNPPAPGRSVTPAVTPAASAINFSDGLAGLSLCFYWCARRDSNPRPQD